MWSLICGVCGRRYSFTEFRSLELVGLTDLRGAGEGAPVLELRDCPCGDTLSAWTDVLGNAVDGQTCAVIVEAMTSHGADVDRAVVALEEAVWAAVKDGATAVSRLTAARTALAHAVKAADLRRRLRHPVYDRHGQRVMVSIPEDAGTDALHDATRPADCPAPFRPLHKGEKP